MESDERPTEPLPEWLADAFARIEISGPYHATIERSWNSGFEIRVSQVGQDLHVGHAFTEDEAEHFTLGPARFLLDRVTDMCRAIADQIAQDGVNLKRPTLRLVK